MGSTKSAPEVFRSVAGRARYFEAYDAALREWPAPFEEIDISTSLGTTHVIANGSRQAPPVVLLPSLAASAIMWKPTVAALSMHFRTYAIDTIGQTGKSVPSKHFRSRSEMAQWLTDLFDGLGVARASIVGSSYGAFLALNQASLTPDRVDRIVLIGPAATFVGFSWRFYYVMLVKIPMRKLLRGKRTSDSTTLPGGTRLAPDGWGRLMSVTMSESARPTLARPIVFSGRELRAVKAPVLLLVGEREVLYKPEPTLRLAMQRMPGLTGAVIPNADHLASISAPAEVNARVLEFLQSG
ncbi:MAG TPA: alpha/beta hydrolase [Rhizomicrobium sp.]|nr:alpha/beta hydrolase [Rhizomicrobium sp.]